MLNIGNIIRELRKEHGLTQTQLAKEISSSQDTISLWELGKSNPDLESVVKLAKLFNVTTDYLLGMKEI